MSDSAKQLITNQLTLKPINKLFEYSFYIPAYQRGYRWTETQVKNLLVDIWLFTGKKEKKNGEFYCLQPIVVKKLDNKIFEIIDGQQRFTTIFLILKYLEKLINDAFNNFSFSPPLYDTRKNNKEFLDNINTKTEKEAIRKIDDFHIWKAYDIIKEWFENKENNINKIDFLNTLLKYNEEEQDGNTTDTSNNVRVIWYEINDDETNDSIDIFTRLNIGKIPLTDA